MTRFAIPWAYAGYYAQVEADSVEAACAIAIVEPNQRASDAQGARSWPPAMAPGRPIPIPKFRAPGPAPTPDDPRQSRRIPDPAPAWTASRAGSVPPLQTGATIMRLAFADPRNMTISPLNMHHRRPKPDVSDIRPSIARRGVLVPLLVQETFKDTVIVPGHFEIVGGARRWYAAMDEIAAGVEIDPVPSPSWSRATMRRPSRLRCWKTSTGCRRTRFPPGRPSPS